MWNEPTDVELARMPRLGTTGNAKWQEILIHQHYFLGGSDWYTAEYDAKDRLFFGYAILNGDLECSEWGYVAFDELRNVRVRGGFQVDRDLHWQVRRAVDVDKIAAAHRARGLTDRIPEEP